MVHNEIVEKKMYITCTHYCKFTKNTPGFEPMIYDHSV